MNATKANEIFERYAEQFKTLNARIYTQAQTEDLLMLRWWMHVSETGDITKFMLPEAQRLPAFLNVFKPPTALVYSLSTANEIISAFWATPVDVASTHKAAYCGLWVHPGLRGKRYQYNFTHMAYTFAFEFYSTLLGMTWQPDLLDIHKKLGYNVVGCIPHLYDQDFLYIVHLTREAFDASRFMQVGRRQ